MTAQRPKYSVEFKKEVCQYARKENIKSAAAVYSVHRNTIRNWMKKYKKSGVKAFIVKRNDTQVTKLDVGRLEKIARYKRKNPKATLGEIKSRFRLDCHITLIGRKLGRIYKPVKKNSERYSLYFQTKIIRLKKNDSNPVFRLSLHLCCGKPLSVGFTTSYSSEKICLFISYSLDKLKHLKNKRKFSKIIANTRFLKPADFKNIVAEDHNVELEIICGDKLKVGNDNDIGHTTKSIKYSLTESFERVLNKFKTGDLDDVLLAALVNIDELTAKVPAKQNWDYLFMPAETKKSLFAALERIKSKGDQAVMCFDYNYAKEEYDKVYTAITLMCLKDKEIYLSILSSKAKLYYDTEKYQTALMIFRDIVRFSRKNSEFIKEHADALFFIAMIYKNFQNNNGAIKYFRMSAKLTEKRKNILSKYMCYRAMYREFLTKAKFDEAEKYSKLFTECAVKTGYKDLIGNCLSTRGLYLYHIGKYELFEKALLEAKEYNVRNNNLYEITNNITNLLSIYSYYIIGEEGEIEDILKELKLIANKINLPHLIYESMYRIGIYYYKKSKNEEALKILKKTLPGVKKYLSKEAYLSALCYIGGLYFDMGVYISASKHLTALIRESIKTKNNIFLERGIWYLTRIYIQRGDTKRAVTLLKKGIKTSISLKNKYACAHYHKLYAEICESKNMNQAAEYQYSQALSLYIKYGDENNYDISEEIQSIDTKILFCK
jgi:transposase-like protein